VKAILTLELALSELKQTLFVDECAKSRIQTINMPAVFIELPHRLGGDNLREISSSLFNCIIHLSGIYGDVHK
jgi:hypothetical protein